MWGMGGRGGESVPAPVTPGRGKRREVPFRPGVQPLASQGWLMLPKAAPLGGISGVDSGDLRWQMDERGGVFSLILGKKICSIKGAISQTIGAISQ